ncbi:MAG: tetratricopeptide repeat protein [Desulfobacterales bacterium]|nr:tetratricopeptide repeat protein [Desulfobacterales bacterium]
MTEKKQSFTVFIIFVLWIFIIYSNTLNGPFVFDDKLNIRDNSHIRLTKLTIEGIEKAGFESHASNRPVANITFALNYYLHKYNLPGYHLFNILIHIITGILLYFFVKTILKILNPNSENYNYQQPAFQIAFFTALIWLVHPVQTQSVTYIVQRMNIMAAMFYILSLLCYIKARISQKKIKKLTLFTTSAFAGILGVGSKEIAVTLPFFIFFYEWYFFQKFNKRYLLFFLAGILIFFALFSLAYLGASPVERILADYSFRDFTLKQRVLTEFRVIIFYISLIIFPHPSRLNLVHDFPLSYSLADPITTLLCLLIITASIGLAFYLAKKKQALLSFCILWFFGNLLIESSVLGLEIIFEHRIYMPSMLMILMGVSLVYRLKIKRLPEALLIIISIFFSLWTHERNYIWSDDVLLWKDCVKKSPMKARPYGNLGTAFINRGLYKEAIPYLRKEAELAPSKKRDALTQWGLALRKIGKNSEAIEKLSEAVKIEPFYDSPYLANQILGEIFQDIENWEKAEYYFSKALLKSNPHPHLTLNSLGIALVQQGKTEGAIKRFRQAADISPSYKEPRRNLKKVADLLLNRGAEFEIKGLIEKAIPNYKKAVELNPEFAEAYLNLGNALAKTGKIREAVKAYRKILEINPNHEKARFFLKKALTYLEQNR